MLIPSSDSGSSKRCNEPARLRLESSKLVLSDPLTVVDSVLMDGSAVLGCRRVVASVLGREAKVQRTRSADGPADDAAVDLSVLLGDHSVVDLAGGVDDARGWDG